MPPARLATLRYRSSRATLRFQEHPGTSPRIDHVDPGRSANAVRLPRIAAKPRVEIASMFLTASTTALRVRSEVKGLARSLNLAVTVFHLIGRVLKPSYWAGRALPSISATPTPYCKEWSDSSLVRTIVLSPSSPPPMTWKATSKISQYSYEMDQAASLGA